ncbi:MAG: RraA family protein [Chloroflexota bacterium]
MSAPDTDDLLATLRRLAYSAVVSDACDGLGLRTQSLAPGILPLDPAGPVLVGRARPVHSRAVMVPADPPYAAEIAFIDSLGPDDVVVAKVDAPTAFWGELFSAAARARGASGIVVDGFIRDQAKIRGIGFPAFSRGGHPTDSLGRLSVAETDVPLEVAGVTVHPGDIVVADLDGVVVIPQGVAADVTARVVEKAATEDRARRLLQTGGYLRDAWDRFKVL